MVELYEVWVCVGVVRRVGGGTIIERSLQKEKYKLTRGVAILSMERKGGSGYRRASQARLSSEGAVACLPPRELPVPNLRGIQRTVP